MITSFLYKMFRNQVLIFVPLLWPCFGTVSLHAPDWWKTAVIYQIYPRSFKDSNSDGTGDLKGVTSKLDHLVDIGVSAVWLSPIYRSPGVDHGYDISDYREIDPLFGDLNDFRELLVEAHARGIRVVLDLVPNHTSDEHEWFVKSANRTVGYEEYYVWSDRPNNWIGYFHGSAWQYHSSRKQYYLHHFHAKQPDLNYRNPRVAKEMEEVLRYWLEMGVDGFRVDIVSALFEKDGYPDEPACSSCDCKRSDYCFGSDPFDKNPPRMFCTLDHVHTMDQPETYEMLHRWRKLVDSYGGVLMTEAYSDRAALMLYYGNETHDAAHFTFNFWMITRLDASSNARDFKHVIEEWLAYMPLKYSPNWVLGNHDQHRVATRYGPRRVDGLNMLVLSLPGVAVTYNGEEIGMQDGSITFEQGTDPQACNGKREHFSANSRDFERTPFQWDSSKNAGFSDANSTWLPVGIGYEECNLERQKSEGEKSHYGVYKRMVELRKKDPFKFGDLKVVALSANVLGLMRRRSTEMYILVVNFANSSETVQLQHFCVPDVPVLEVSVANSESERKQGDSIENGSLKLRPWESLLLGAS